MICISLRISFVILKGDSMRPQKLTMSRGKRVLSDYGSRQDEYREYNRMRWKYDREVKAFYNSKVWIETSKIVLLENNYVCEYCGGEATMTDHYIPIKRDWSKRLDRKNLKASCKRCNDRRAILERNNLL
jgi:5-methylcytosine-specific restriction endonuclease McrA